MPPQFLTLSRRSVVASLLGLIAAAKLGVSATASNSTLAVGEAAAAPEPIRRPILDATIASPLVDHWYWQQRKKGLTHP
jgi:hypothetical protein